MSDCPICENSSCTPFQQKDGRSLLICETCRHVFWDQMPAPDELARYYANDYTAVHEQCAVQDSNVEYYRSHADELTRLAAPEGRGLRIADIGCSYPVFLREAKAKGAERVIGVDYSKEAHEAGAQWGVEMMTHERFQQIPDHSVDVLRYSHVLEHLIDPKAVLHAQLRKLRPGGLLYVTHPNFPVFEVAPTTVDLHDSFFPNHLHFFNPLSCVALCGPNLVVEKLFSVSDELDAFERYRSIMDLRYASERLEPLRDRGEAVRGPLNGWPFYTGINIGLYARLSPAGGPRNSEPI